ncbi:MAG: DUF6128 domain-containing protein, partial [Eubacteriales bacterium]|nr:DUF6128 domain-containing protein [Eubacteriales bacterium]
SPGNRPSPESLPPGPEDRPPSPGNPPSRENRPSGRPAGPGSRPARPGGSRPPGVPCTPFPDSDFPWCSKLQPRDLPRILPRQRGLLNNRFLQYGFHNFGHILLCRRPDGQYLLGVPGVYDQQEGFMARMFGFPYFKESPLIQVPRGRGGYWYRLMDSPDFH